MEVRTRLERRNIHSARERLRHYLVLHAGPDGRTIKLPGTIKELAADMGLSHEAVYRTLASMAAEGEISRSKTLIKLLRAV
jgi:CRP/FNR family transcriptional regulator, dissimilatory nitrate respiration regulator